MFKGVFKGRTKWETQFLKVRGSFTEFKNLTFKDIELVTILYDFRHVRK